MSGVYSYSYTAWREQCGAGWRCRSQHADWCLAVQVSTCYDRQDQPPPLTTSTDMAGDGSDTQTVTRRKRTTNSKEVKNVRKEKKTREVEGAPEESLKNVVEKVTEETSADIQKELSEKLAGLLERDRLGVSLGQNDIGLQSVLSMLENGTLTRTQRVCWWLPEIKPSMTYNIISRQPVRAWPGLTG